MYLFNKDMKNELLQGMKIVFIANKLEISPNGLRNVLNGKRRCSKMYSWALISLLGYGFDDIEKYFRKG